MCDNKNSVGAALSRENCVDTNGDWNTKLALYAVKRWRVKPVIFAFKNDCQSFKDWQSLKA
jgi:hypothetical protein